MYLLSEVSAIPLLVQCREREMILYGHPKLCYHARAHHPLRLQRFNNHFANEHLCCPRFSKLFISRLSWMMNIYPLSENRRKLDSHDVILFCICKRRCGVVGVGGRATVKPIVTDER